MKKWFVIIAAMLFVSIASIAYAGGSNNSCAVKYPIVMAHGMGASAQILGIINYWNRIPGALQDQGAKVYITSVNGMDSTANKGAAWKTQFLQIKAITGAAKLNVIGHSHGTIYTRYAISNLGLCPYVASYTSIAGPHRGSAIADVIMGVIPNSIKPIVGATLDFVYAFIFGDKNPNSVQNGWDLVRSNMINVFNPNTPNKSGIYYQSAAAKIKMMAIDARNWYFIATWPILCYYEGANDGLVSITSAQWGNFRGTQEGSWYSAGVDHLNIIDEPFGVTPGFDAPGFFVNIVADLKNRGY